jgi:hypothetical protein
MAFLKITICCDFVASLLITIGNRFASHRFAQMKSADKPNGLPTFLLAIARAFFAV